MAYIDYGQHACQPENQGPFQPATTTGVEIRRPGEHQGAPGTA